MTFVNYLEWLSPSHLLFFNLQLQISQYLLKHAQYGISSIFHHTIFFKNVKVSRSWSRPVKKKCHTAESSMISPSRVLLHCTATYRRAREPLQVFVGAKLQRRAAQLRDKYTPIGPSCVTDRLAKQSVQPNPSAAHFVFCRILQNFILLLTR